MEETLLKLRLLPDGLSSKFQKQLEKLTAIHQQLKTEVGEITESLPQAQCDRFRKQRNYLAKLKICIKIYSTFNEKLTKDIKSSKLWAN